jgi:hypothetical protein
MAALIVIGVEISCRSRRSRPRKAEMRVAISCEMDAARGVASMLRTMSRRCRILYQGRR